MRLIIIIFLIFSSFSANSQEFTFERINSTQGLSQNDVVDIFQDNQGYLWIATHEGINRYDGIEFEVFRFLENDPNSISSSLINRVSEDNNGNIWISTIDKGVCMYNPENGTFKRYLNTSQNPNLLTSNAIRNIFCDSHDRIFIATEEGVDYLEKTESGDYKAYHIQGLPSYKKKASIYNNFYEDKLGNVMVILWDRIAKINIPVNKNEDPYLEHIFQELPFNNIRIISEFNNTLLVGHGNGFSQVVIDSTKQNSYKITTTKTGRVADFIQIDNKTVWVGSDIGVFRLEYSGSLDKGFIQTHHFTAGDNEYSISNNNVISISKDNAGGIWIGSNGGGICKLSTLNRQFRSYKSTLTHGSLSTNKILAIFEDPQNNLWIGTEGGGVNYLSGSKAKDYSSGFVKYYNNMPNEQNTVYKFCSIKSDSPEIWMGTAYNSLIAKFKLNNKSKWDLILSHIPIKNNIVISLFQDENGNVWIGTYLGGLYKAIPNNGTYRLIHFTMSNSNICSNIILSFLEDSKGRLWIGSIDGLMLLNADEKGSDNPNFTTFKQSNISSDSLSNSHILPIIESQDRSVWIGTMGGGLNKYIEGDKWNNGYFKSWTEEDGLSNNSIKELIEDNSGDFWIGSNKGLTRFNPKTCNIRNYNYKDGLQSFEFTELAGCKRHDGEILMGGVNGFNAFYPEDIKDDTIPPNLLFTKLEIINKQVKINEKVNGKIIFNKALNNTKEITLCYDENNFTIHFVALHMSNPESNQYKYRMVGYDKDWIKTSSQFRFAKYTNLSEGKYTFEAIASNSDGYWTPDAKQITIIIKPPFYRTLTFNISAIIFLIVLISFFFILKINMIHKQKKMLEKVVADRTLELMERNAKIEESNEEISVQKEALEIKSNELEYHKENLEHLVNERTNELEIALEKAQESDKLKSAFLANMSHEIRTPMNAIVGFSGLIVDQKLSIKEQLKYKEIIHANSQKLLLLIDDILALSLIESNQLRVYEDPFYINTLLDENILTAKVNSKNDNVKFVLNNKLENKNLQILSDKLRISQIITNLLGNAVKFTNEGKISLNARFDNEKNLIISVADTGIGIDNKNIEYVFDRFRKCDDVNSNLYSGVGLGLSISYKLSQLLNCKIWVTSTLGKGSEFFLLIPNKYILI